MSRAAESIHPEASLPPAGTTPKRLCPFCGTVNEREAAACTRCGMEDSPATRQATRARIGPWHVLQSRNPAAPGMKFSTLVSLVKKGQVTPRSIVRGPTTQQFWTLAGNVKGLSREFGLCYACGGDVDTMANLCPHCQRIQEPPINPDVLLEGLASAETAPSAARRPQRPYAPEPTVNVDLDSPAVPASPSSSYVPPAPAAPQTPQLQQHPQQLPARSPQQPQQPNPGILTAKELATAFQLEFQPQSKTPPKKRRRRRFARAVLALLFLGAIGAGVVGYLRPDLREQSIEWVRTTGEQLKARFEKGEDNAAPAAKNPIFTRVRPSPGDAGNNSGVASPESTSTAKVDPMMARPALPEEPKAPLPAPSPNPTPVVTKEDPAEKAAETQLPAAASAEQTSAAPKIVKVPPPTKPDVAPEPKAEPEPEPEPTPMSEEAVRDQVRMLRRAAIDAEVDHDYAKAVRLYEQIKKLPRDKWPLDLEVRLNYARQQIK